MSAPAHGRPGRPEDVLGLPEGIVLTSRRAWRGGGTERLRLTGSAVELTGGEPLHLPIATVRGIRVVRRRWIVLTTDMATVRFRCFGAPAVAALIRRCLPG